VAPYYNVQHRVLNYRNKLSAQALYIICRWRESVWSKYQFYGRRSVWSASPANSFSASIGVVEEVSTALESSEW